jgi:hypothetical protein
MYDTGVRMIPLDGCYMLQRYRPDFDDWVNFAVYDTEAAAFRRLQKYTQPPVTTNITDTKDTA